jgi:helicase
VRVGGAIHELAAFGLPEPVLRAWANRFHTGLNDLQQQAVNDYRVLDGRSLLIVAPTSSGKTMIGEMAAVRAVTEGRKAVFLLPYKALTSEKYDEFDALYGTELGLRVIRCTGDYIDQTAAFARGKYDLACMTYEMFLSLAVSNTATLSQIGLVVLDEAQFVCEPKRGITVELLLTFLIAARERGIQPQIVALSAVIGDLNYFHEWLGCEALVTDRRPVKLV